MMWKTTMRKRRRSNNKKMKTGRQKAASWRAQPGDPLVLEHIQQVHGPWLVVLSLEMWQDKQAEIGATIIRVNSILSLIKVSPSLAMGSRWT